MKGKVYVITGGAAGIGLATANAITAAEGRVLLVDINEDALATATTNRGDQVATLTADVGHPDAPSRIAAAAIDRFGRVDGLMNSAAFIPRAGLQSTDRDTFDRVMATNVRAAFLLIKALLEPLSESRGSVLNIGSINANSGEPDLFAYSVSKGALQTLTRNLGDSLHREFGIRVNQINPGWVLTETERQTQRDVGFPDDWPSRLPKEFNPSGELIKPETIADAACFWLSDRSRPVSGSVVEMEQFPMIGRNPPKTPLRP